MQKFINSFFLKVLLNSIIASIISLNLILTYLNFIKSEKNKDVISIKLDNEKLKKLKELSKKDFRDAEDTMLMIAEQYIEYHEEEVKK
jgi:hypothetical protein